MQRWLRHIPNLVSSLRIVLVLPIVLALLDHRFAATLWLFGVAAVSDGVDGFLARRFGWQSELGGMLDPVADKLMLAAVFITLAYLGAVPIWLTMVVIARDCIIVLGALAYRVLIGAVKARPSAVSKLNTLCQLIFIVAAVAAQQFWSLQATVLVLGAVVFVTAVVSGIDYVLVYAREALRESKSPRGFAGGGRSKPA